LVGAHHHRSQSSTWINGPTLDAESSSDVSDPEILTDEPTLEEVAYAKRKLRNGRAEGIPPELLKCAIDPVSHALHAVA